VYSDVMPRQRVDLRLDEDLVAWADGYAAERRWTRTTVFEAALEALRGDGAGGVPELPAAVARGAGQAGRRVVRGRVTAPVRLAAPARVTSAEDGGEGPSFGSTLDQAHAWFGEHGGNYAGWRSRRDRWLRQSRGRS
jgi:hypothetical protein